MYKYIHTYILYTYSIFIYKFKYMYMYIITVKEIKTWLKYLEFHTKHVYNLQPNYSHCSNVKNYGVKVSLFLLWRQGFGSSTQEFVTYTCFDDNTSILLQIFCLLSCFLCLPIFPASYSNKGNISLIEVCIR